MATWRRNLYVLCFSQLLTMIGFSSYFSFIPYYLQEELGARTFAEATAWLAVFQTGGAIAMMVSAPIWGSLADRYGRKMMLIRATGAGAILAFVMSLAQSPAQLAAIRVMQGIFCGTVGAATAMVATQTPEEHLGFGLGLMQTAQFLAMAIGPVVGGLAADSLGYRAVFPISSALMAVALLLVLIIVKERFVARPVRRRTGERSRRGLSGSLTRGTWALLASLGTISFAMAVLSPIMSLYIKSLDPSAPRLATLAGTVTSVSAITSSLAAIGIGRLGDKVGQKLVLVVCTVGVALMHIPQAFVANAGQLILLRAIQGVFTGGMMPTANALLARTTPPSKRATLFGFATSVQSGGRAVGPVLGAAVGNSAGMSSVFLVTAGAFGLVAALVASLVPRKSVLAVEEDAEDEAPAVTQEPVPGPAGSGSVRS